MLQELSMPRHRMPLAALIAISLLALADTGAALASTVTLSDSTTSTGTINSGANTTLPVPGSYTYADTFAAGSGGTAVSGTPYGFFDDYVFTITGASADSVTSTIDLGGTLQIDGLQVGLFSYAPGQTLPIYGSTLPFGSVAVDGWSTPISSGSTTGTISVIPATNLTQGTYALEVLGTVTGSAGGSYSGVLDLTPVPVPLPAALPLLLSGLGGLGLWGRRRLPLGR
jgi:hypothetical protein